MKRSDKFPAGADYNFSPLRLRIAFCFLIITLLPLAGTVSAATVTIENTTAGGISTAITNAGIGGTVILNPGTYFQHSLLIPYDVTIQANTASGGTAANTIIDAQSSDRIFDNSGGFYLTIDNVTMQNGNAGAGNGGAIKNSGGILIIKSSTFSGCSATNGGAIWNSGTLIVTASTFSNCQASAYGGAVFVDNSGSATITTTSFTGCQATTGGGAVATLPGTVTITSSRFTGCSGGADGGGAMLSSATTTVHFSRFYSNSATGGGAAIRFVMGSINATGNWWGTNEGPGTTFTGPAVPSWLMLNATASPVSITSSQASLIRANLTFDSAGTDTSGSGHVLNGTPVTFAIASGAGSLSTLSNTTTLGGSETTFTPAGGGTTVISATVDGQTVTVPVSVTGPAFTGSPTSGNAPLTVTFTDTSAGSPTMWNWSFGDGQWFNTTVATNPSHTYTSAGTYTVSLTATIGGTPSTYTKASYVTAATSGGNPIIINSGGGGGDIVPVNVPKTVTSDMAQNPPAVQFVNVGGGTAVTKIIATGTGLNNIIFTSTPLNPTTLPQLPGTPYEINDITPAGFTTITGSTILFSVPGSWLEEHHLTPQDIVMYHYTGGNWVALPTAPVLTVTSGGAVNGGTVTGGTVNGGTISGGTISGLIARGTITTGPGTGGTGTGGTGTGGTGTGGTGTGGTGTGGTGTGGTGTGGTSTTGPHTIIVTGGTITGGTITGGTINGGVVNGGTINGGTVITGTGTPTTVDLGSGSGGAGTGGTLTLGTGTLLISGGTGTGGTISGATITGATLVRENGETLTGVTVHDGTIAGGTVSGGTITGGSVNGGIITGGTPNGASGSGSSGGSNGGSSGTGGGSSGPGSSGGSASGNGGTGSGSSGAVVNGGGLMSNQVSKSRDLLTHTYAAILGGGGGKGGANPVEGDGYSPFAIVGKPSANVSLTTTPQVRTLNEVAGYTAAGQEPVGTPPSTTRPAITTTQIPAPVAEPEPVIPLPVLAIAGIAVLVAGGWYARRWWIRRQNPALFREDD